MLMARFKEIIYEESYVVEYFKRVKEIQQLQWELFIDYWYLHIAVVLLGIVIVVVWVIKK